MAVPAGSMAAVKVDLRVEGSSKTLFEKAVAAGPETLRSNAGPNPGRFPCDVIENGGSGKRAATPISALAPTRLKLGLNWYPEYTGFLVDSIGAEDPADPAYWDFWVNGKGAVELEYLGGCQLGLKKGDSVVWAVTDGSQSLLMLKASGSGSGPTVRLTATSGATGVPVVGAKVGRLTTGADGTVEVPRPSRGSVRFKATADGFIRSNAVKVSARR
ncbi:MAG: DUF4430 domain-containing protein [Solirubrobacteraceae bacterium]|nr:DUF4430 domain-containing protein [Solirubrobacteraceae bacterium]